MCSILQTLLDHKQDLLGGSMSGTCVVAELAYLQRERFSMSCEKYPKVKDIMLKHELLKVKVTI